MYKINLKPHDSAQSVITIGNFDGLHLGHLQLLNTMRDLARQKNYRTIVITFEPLPLDYFSDQKALKRQPRLSLLRDKYLILKQLGFIDELIVLHFNSSVANLSPDEFIQHVLCERLNVAHVVIGHDFKFGKGGVGHAADFIKHGVATTIIDQYNIIGARVSSSIIRSLARENALVEVKKYLGRNLQYTSRVIFGNQLGRKFGVPTINLSLGRNFPALWGIYVALVHIEGKTYHAVASIGKNPSVTTSENYKLEAHLLDVDLNLYGKIATIEVLTFMREERKFSDLDLLFKQIHQDLADARQYFRVNSPNHTYVIPAQAGI